MKIKTMSKIGLSAICLAGMVASANATPVTPLFSLCTGNSDISGFAGPYGSVDVVLTSPTTATITFMSATTGANPFLFGAQGVVAVNVNATSWTVSAITESNVGTGFDTTVAPSNGGSAQENGFGVFNQTLDNFDGYTHSASTVSFTLTDTSGTWASAANVLTPNAQGYSVAAHIFVTTSPINAGTGALATGYAAGCPVPGVPDGGTTAALLGLGLLGLGSVRRSFGKK